MNLLLVVMPLQLDMWRKLQENKINYINFKVFGCRDYRNVVLNIFLELLFWYSMSMIKNMREYFMMPLS